MHLLLFSLENAHEQLKLSERWGAGEERMILSYQLIRSGFIWERITQQDICSSQGQRCRLGTDEKHPHISGLLYNFTGCRDACHDTTGTHKHTHQRKTVKKKKKSIRCSCGLCSEQPSHQWACVCVYVYVTLDRLTQRGDTVYCIIVIISSCSQEIRYVTNYKQESRAISRLQFVIRRYFNRISCRDEAFRAAAACSSAGGCT